MKIMEYSHTQKSKLYLWVLVIEIILFSIIIVLSDFELTLAFLFLFLVFITYSFTSLTVTVNKEYLQCRFSYGIFQKRFAIKDISSAKVVRNHWYYGWGIRVWFWPYMWIYNLSGLDAVEIKTSNSKTYRIGTDEPHKLHQAISEKIT